MGNRRALSRRVLVCLLILVGAILAAVFVGGCSMVVMPGRSYSGPFHPLSNEERELRESLVGHIRVLAGEIGERHMGRPEALTMSAAYIERRFRDAWLSPASQEFQVQGQAVRNIEVEVRGTATAGEIVVVGAHYDSVSGCPGANDNATGVAAVIEIARYFSRVKLGRTLRLVAFVNEEPPFFRTPGMGSLVYARRCRQRQENVVGMLSLETIGYYSDAKGSQKYLSPFNYFYPSRGNFIGFVGSFASWGFTRRVAGSFRRHTSFPSEGAIAPQRVTGIDWSDHWAFWEQGYPAVMVTDTAPFRYPYYHTEQDTPDKVCYDHLARVVAGLIRVVEDLTGAAPR